MILVSPMACTVSPSTGGDRCWCFFPSYLQPSTNPILEAATKPILNIMLTKGPGVFPQSIYKQEQKEVCKSLGKNLQLKESFIYEKVNRNIN